MDDGIGFFIGMLAGAFVTLILIFVLVGGTLTPDSCSIYAEALDAVSSRITDRVCEISMDGTSWIALENYLSILVGGK